MYTIEEHQHRIASWAAARAVRGVLGATVERCRSVMERCGINREFGVTQLEDTADGFDRQHSVICDAMINAANTDKLSISYGVAAKWLNVYLKIRFVCGPDHNGPRIGFIHPPIDRLLLNRLAQERWGGNPEVWRKYVTIGWKSFSSDDYQGLIAHLRRHLKDEPFWTVERYWRGHD